MNRLSVFLPIIAAVAMATSSGCGSLGQKNDPVTVAAVQFEIRDEMIADAAVFLDEIEVQIKRAVTHHRADMVVFPEYTGVFLTLLEYGSSVAGTANFAEGLEKIIQSDSRVDSLKELLIHKGERIELGMDSVFGGKARQYGIYIVAGTAFVPGRNSAGEAVLFNRAFVYGPEGDRIYTQDKVFLTPFETELVELSPGSLDKAAGFVLEDKHIVLTICRDTFMEEWDSRFSDADLWIDVKANGDRYDREQSENFKKALPERISKSGVPYGITVCLTGAYLDLFWEGESSVIRKAEKGYSIVETADNWTGLDILYFTLPN